MVWKISLASNGALYSFVDRKSDVYYISILLKKIEGVMVIKNKSLAELKSCGLNLNKNIFNATLLRINLNVNIIFGSCKRSWLQQKNPN